MEAPTRKIKVLFAINELLTGGAQNMMIEQFHALDRARFEPYVLTLRTYTPPDLRAKLKAPPERIAAFSFKGFLDIPSWVSIYRFMRKERFDVVITNLFLTNVVIRVIAILVGTKGILTYEHNVYRNKRLWQITVDKVLAKFTFRILAGAPQVKAFTTAQEGLPADKVQVIYDAADLVFEDAKEQRSQILQQYGLPEDRLYIVACGRLDEQKGHTYFIEAAHRILAKRIDSREKLQFLIFGRGVLENELTEQIQKSGLEGRVRLMGVAPMKDILAISDVFSLVSLWEGFSVALIQAMNAGCAIVASNVSGSEDAIDDGVNGFLVIPGDPEAAAGAIERFIEDPALRVSAGAAAKERSKLFNMEHQIRKLESLMAESLSLSEGYSTMRS